MVYMVVASGIYVIPNRAIRPTRYTTVVELSKIICVAVAFDSRSGGSSSGCCTRRIEKIDSEVFGMGLLKQRWYRTIVVPVIPLSTRWGADVPFHFIYRLPSPLCRDSSTAPLSAFTSNLTSACWETSAAYFYDINYKWRRRASSYYQLQFLGPCLRKNCGVTGNSGGASFPSFRTACVWNHTLLSSWYWKPFKYCYNTLIHGENHFPTTRRKLWCQPETTSSCVFWIGHHSPPSFGVNLGRSVVGKDISWSFQHTA